MSLRSNGGTKHSESEPLLPDTTSTSDNPLQPTGPQRVNEEYHVQCWGCSLDLTLPSYSPIFKCGYCGAVSEENEATASAPSSSSHRRHPPRCPQYFVVRDRVVTSAVLLLILAIIGGGVWSIFPVLFPERNFVFFLNSAATLLFSCNTLFNFSMSVLSPAGQVAVKPWGLIERVERGSLDGYKFCDKCGIPKPMGAHHCRQCRECVMEMDHHCPFIGNCVGASNQRHFVLFLIWVMFSCFYVFVMCCTAMAALWPSTFHLRDSPRLHGSGGFLGINALKAVLNFQASLSFQFMVLSYLLMASLATIAGVGMLLYQQLQLILEGQTYIDFKKDSMSARSRFLPVLIYNGVVTQSLGGNLRRVFGNDPPFMWLMPRLRPPPGSYADFLRNKKHIS